MAPVSYETNFDDAALVPQKGDNCAIATSTLAQGTKLAYGERVLVLDYTVVEGHRFAIAFIPKGGHLLSWGLSFGQAIEDIQPGQSVANDGISEALAISPLKHHPLRHTANFENYIEPPPPVDSTSSVLQLSKKSRSTFQGYMRPDGRVGTRNYILILGVSYEVAPLVRAAEKRLKSVTLPHNVTGFCCVGHSETLGGNNDAIVRRCLRNFAAHPNVAYTVLVHSVSDVHVALADELPHATRVSSAGDFDEAVDAICAAAKNQIPKAAQFKRTEVSASKLDIALQCGGSDAFSGISGNPVAGLAAKIAIEEGGRALLAETDELIGAEAYIMKGATPSAQTEFLAIIDRFKDYTARHGHGAEGNPSYGNKLRGLYNIAIKSLGAAMKKHDLVPLEGCVEYGVPMPEKSGYYFMDSPGNDLESIAGQVASGCNVIYFITGNGSITNFPFVPTVKIMTTNNRFQLLKNDMDFNAGRLQLGEPMNQLADDLFQNTLAIASGRCSVGELSGQSQVLIWRDWYIPQGGTPASGHEVSEAPLQADEVVDDIDTANLEYWAYKKNDDYAADDVIVIFGTSLCSGEVALQIAHEVSLRLGRRCVALAHTEGCGCSNGTQQEQLFVSTMVRHCFHRSVAQVFIQCGLRTAWPFRKCSRGSEARATLSSPVQILAWGTHSFPP
eukprot:GEMP01010473.1.p1 GENE.GEMP01010473.1~~GEMP01010473.1.p1  ORF type:complete len:672 (+),score=134.63 GEMP01010473.1:216-2231(+)